MFRQLIVGGAISLVNIAIHAVVTTAVIATAHYVLQWSFGATRVRLASVMVATVGVLMAAHVAEVAAWSAAYAIVGSAPPGADLLYFAFVNYTTLGYGDILPTERWRLLGPMAAMNGVLLFGWSTAVIFEVLIQAIRLIKRDDRD